MSAFYTENNQWAIKSSKCQRVLIFGAKENAERIYKSWMREPKTDGFLVSKRGDNPYVLADKPVYSYTHLEMYKAIEKVSPEDLVLHRNIY
ncbi:MAG: hypothetical protein HFI66_02650 [Lachnospiraceae bacterium]|jgi:hypothetical protein|nr:hypothetical protein [Lachnospiraceae bacterium]